ncbi:flavin-containing monooxygenase [Geopyxis carbonaria]|nr:flavin-containing monooxygenase [Geopyxis carbonaria]
MAPPVSLTPATLPPPAPAPTDFTPIKEWLSAYNKIAASPSASNISDLFLDNSYWRDHLCLSWDYITAHGPSKIFNLVTAVPSSKVTALELAGEPFAAPIDYEGQIHGITAFVNVKTSVGHGRGLVKLLPDGGKWKAFSVFTALYGLDKFPERTGANRPSGVTHGATRGRKNWKERREAEKAESKPVVVIIGAGQGGLVTAARLKVLGIETVIVEQNDRVGDNWRKRYHQLVLHDPVYYDHMPYLPFPENWPIFTPKDKLGDWFETYASVLELNILTSTTLTASSYSAATSTWTLTLSTPTGPRTLTPKHLVLATGHSGEPNFPSHIPGIADNTFKGDVLCHSSAFPGAKPNTPGRRAVVVGCCNSGHDIAQDFYEKGYDVTIVQRSTTYVMSSEHGLAALFTGLYDATSPPTDDADVLFMANPIAVLKRNHIGVTNEIARRDADSLAGLRAAGFNLDTGPDGSGFFMKYLERGGGYYLDVGASALLASGAIKLHAGREIAAVLPTGLRFNDGSELQADEIVFATGYANMVTTAAKILGKDAVEGVEDVWGIDGETMETRGMWRAAKRGLWFMGGNLALTRWYSRMVALGIAAREAGLVEGGSEEKVDAKAESKL